MESMKGLFKTILDTDMVFLDGMTGKYFKVNGKWEQKTDMVYGEGMMAATMKGNGI